MSTISGIGGAAGAWSAAASMRAQRPPGGAEFSKAFAKIDSDGSGGIDKAELQTLLDDAAKTTGADASATVDDLHAALDANGDGSIGKDELAAGMRSLMPEPASTVAFAQQRGEGGAGAAHGPGGLPPGPPPGGPGDVSGTNSTDPLDADGDGVVSAAERAAGASENDADGKVNGDESNDFARWLAAQLTAALQSSDAGGSARAGSDTAEDARRDAFDLSKLAERLLQRYAATADAGAAQASAVSVLA